MKLSSLARYRTRFTRLLTTFESGKLWAHIAPIVNEKAGCCVGSCSKSGVLGPILDRLQAVSDVGLAETGEATLGSLEGYLDSNPEATELIGHARTIVSRGKMRRPTR